MGLKERLAETHGAYELLFDREIIAGEEWRSTIYQWLFDCAAAVVLVSQQAFDPDKPWVSHEATALTIIQTFRRDLCIIPVLLQGTEHLLASLPTFKPGRLPDIQALRFPDHQRLTTPDALVTAIAERLKAELPRRDNRRLVGLTSALRDTLLEFPESALKAAAIALNLAGTNCDAAQLAEHFLVADEVTAQQAFYALCGKAQDARFFEPKQVVAHILVAQRIKEEHAKPIAVEAAIPSESGSSRALLIDSEDPDVINLYLTRAAQRFPHGWDVTDAPSMLEFGCVDDLKNSVRKIVTAKFGVSAGRSADMQLRRGNAVIGSKRRSGFPVLLRLDYPVGREPAAAFRAIREICPELLVLYTADPGMLAQLPSDSSVCQITPLGLEGYDQMIGPYGALIEHCRNTTPK